MITIKGLFKSDSRKYQDWRKNKFKAIKTVLSMYNVKGDKEKQYKVDLDITIGTRNFKDHKVPRIEVDNVAKCVIDTLACAGIFGGGEDKDMWDNNVYHIDAKIEKIAESERDEMVKIRIYWKDPRELGEWEDILGREDIQIEDCDSDIYKKGDIDEKG